MIYHRIPNIICSLFSIMRFGWIFIITQPMALAELIARFRFSVYWKMFSGLFTLIAFSSIVPGQALFISLHKMIPSPTKENKSKESSFIGKTSLTCGSSYK